MNNSPKVLVVGINPWVDNTGIHTLINFFSNWGTNSLAHLYTRDGLPNTAICNTFFRISENQLIKSIFKRNVKTGESIENTVTITTKNSSAIYQKKHTSLMTFAREIVWVLGNWKTAELCRFLDEFQPDVLFFPVYSTVYMNRLQNFIADYTEKPVILYSSDDNYSYQSISKTPLQLFERFWLRRHETKLFKRANKIMVISPKQKEEYDRLFKTNCTILTKGIDYTGTQYCQLPIHRPIKMVYTGKMIIGRWRSLAAIAEVLGEINAGGEIMVLDIYTTDQLTKEQSAKLNRNGCSVKGGIPLEEVFNVQKNADILVFVESLERKYRYRARLSFSTKLTDYFKVGKCIFAIGDEEIAPIDYLKRFDSAVVATSYEEIRKKLKDICKRPDLIAHYGKKAFDCGQKNHDAEEQKQVLHNEIVEVLCKK